MIVNRPVIIQSNVDFAKKSDVQGSTSIPASVGFIRTNGYTTQGDGGGALYKRASSEPSHSGKVRDANSGWWEIAEPFLNVRMFGATGDGTTDDAAAFQAAIDSASDGSAVHVPVGSYRLASDITWVASRRVSLVGQGQNTSIALDGCGIVITGASSFNRFVLEKLNITRTGTAGVALSINGSTALGVSRWAIRDCFIKSVGGTAIRAEGSWIGLIDNAVINGSLVGVSFEQDAEASTTAMNALTVVGGETQGCTDGWIVKAGLGMYFYGHAIEGNTRGFTSSETDRGILFKGGYFESNSEYDISIGGTSSGFSNAIENCTFLGPTVNTDYAIYLKRGKNLLVEGCSFVNYTVAGVRVTDESGTTTTGRVKNSHLSGTPAAVSVAGTAFGDTLTIRQPLNATAATGVRTEFDAFAVAVPSDICGVATLKMRFRMTSGGPGNVTVGYIAVDDAKVTIGTGSTTVTTPTTNTVYESSLTRDFTAYAGENIVINFRRYGDVVATDTHSGSLEFLGGEISMLTST